MVIKTGIVLYADDIVLSSENESDLQIKLNTLNIWCNKKCLQVNRSKTKIYIIEASQYNRQINHLYSKVNLLILYLVSIVRPFANRIAGL